MVKNLPADAEMQEVWVRSLDGEDPLEEEMATYSSTLAWEIPWTEEPGRLQSMGLQRTGHDCATSLSLVTDGNQTSQGGPLVMYNSNHYVVHLKPITL